MMMRAAAPLYVMTEDGHNGRAVTFNDVLEYIKRIVGIRVHDAEHLHGTAPIHQYADIRNLPDSPNRGVWSPVWWRIWNLMEFWEQQRITALIREENFTSEEMVNICMKACRLYYENDCAVENRGRRFTFHANLYADSQYRMPSGNTTPPLP